MSMANIGQSVDKPGSKGHPIVYGMPWCGTSGVASTKSYPLGGIVLLGRSDNDHFESLTNDQKNCASDAADDFTSLDRRYA